MSNLLTVSQAAKQLGMSAATLYVWCKENKIKHLRYPGGTIRIYQTAVDEILNNEVPVTTAAH